MLLMSLRLKETVVINHSFPVAGIILAAGVMGIVVAVIPSLPLGVIVLAGAVSYSLVLLATRAVTVKDIADLARRVA
jgi:hypothetical protein